MDKATTIDAGGFTFDGATSATTFEPRAYLVVRDGDRTRVIDVDDGADVLIGRSSEATVEIADPQASREHARVVRRGAVLELVDLGSRNGTRLGQEKVRNQRRELRSGDRLQIGAVEILVAQTVAPRSDASGRRLDRELAAALTATGEAALVRLPFDAEALAEHAATLGGALLLEEQSDGDSAALFDRIGAAEAVLQALPGAMVARAPVQGRTVAELWAHTAPTPVRVAVPAGVVVGDPAMVDVFSQVQKLAAAPTTVLILGETGVGKEVVAEALHRQSPRAAQPFVRINCGSLPETLLESELFGHEKGAFTGADRKKLGYIEAAHGGTLFLDEVGELSLGAQTRLLRVLEDRKLMRVGGREEIAVDVRIIAATHRDLEAATRAGQFRPDLYFRLSTFVLTVPPLRARPSEIELFAEVFLRQHAARLNVTAPTIAPEALQVLRRYPWPGNVRELRNAMEHAVLLAERGVIVAENLPAALRRGAAPGAAAGGAMRDQLENLERRAIEDAMDAEGGNQTRAAKRLGISRRGLIYKLEKYGLKT